MNSDWRTELTSVSERNEYILKNSLRADCSFMVGVISEDQRFFQAHKLILSNASAVFERMFYGSLPEKENEAIEISDMDPDDFKSLLHFIYTQEVKIITVNKAQQLYYAASKYMLDQLGEKCLRFLKKKLNAENVCQVYEFAKRFEEQNLEEMCMELIRNQTSAVLSSSTFLLANVTVLDDILSQSSLNITHDSELFNALQDYADFRFSINKRPDPICSACESRITTTPLLENKSENGSNPVEGENIIIGNNNETIGATNSDENKKKALSRELIEDIAYFSKIIKKIRFRTFNYKQFADGPAMSKLLSKADALALLICIIEPKNCKNHFPRGFSDSTQKRSKVANQPASSPNCI